MNNYRSIVQRHVRCDFRTDKGLFHHEIIKVIIILESWTWTDWQWQWEVLWECWVTRLLPHCHIISYHITDYKFPGWMNRNQIYEFLASTSRSWDFGNPSFEQFNLLSTLSPYGGSHGEKLVTHSPRLSDSTKVPQYQFFYSIWLNLRSGSRSENDSCTIGHKVQGQQVNYKLLRWSFSDYLRFF